MEQIAFAVTNVFVDTSILKCRAIQDFSKLEFNSQFNTFMKFLKDNGLEDRYRICIPEIVLEELKKQIYDEYEETKQRVIEDYNRIKNTCGIEIKLEENNYKTKLEEMVDKYVEDNNIIVIPIPKETKIFEKLIDRAINKVKPFSGANSESDKGFKDAIQWESIKAYNRNRYFLEKNMLLTKNSKDFTKELEEEFEKEFNRKIDICYSITDIQDKIMELNELESNLRIVKLILQLQLTNGELNEKVSEALKKEYGELEFEINMNKIEDLIYVENDIYEFFIEGLSHDDEKDSFYFYTYWVRCKLINKNDIEIVKVSLTA